MDRQRETHWSATLRIYGPILAAFAVILLAWSLRDDLESILGSSDSNLFLGDIDGELLDDYKQVIGVAHNAGDRLGSAQLALEHNADAIEIDVVSSADGLYAGHNPPPELISLPMAPPSLATSWNAARQADYVMLDLKQSSRSLQIRLASFLTVRPSDNTIIVSRDFGTLRFFSEETPQATLLLSVPSRGSLDRLLSDEEMLSVVDGVSAFTGVLNEATMAELAERELLVFAWVVNTLPRVNELVAAGVDGIITDNLSILGLLGAVEEETPTPTPE